MQVLNFQAILLLVAVACSATAHDIQSGELGAKLGAGNAEPAVDILSGELASGNDEPALDIQSGEVAACDAEPDHDIQSDELAAILGAGNSEPDHDIQSDELAAILGAGNAEPHHDIQSDEPEACNAEPDLDIQSDELAAQNDKPLSLTDMGLSPRPSRLRCKPHLEVVDSSFDIDQVLVKQHIHQENVHVVLGRSAEPEPQSKW